jgi:hypothetical protein
MGLSISPKGYDLPNPMSSMSQPKYFCAMMAVILLALLEKMRYKVKKYHDKYFYGWPT